MVDTLILLPEMLFAFGLFACEFLEQFTLALTEFVRCFNLDGNDVCTPCGTAHVRHAVVAQLEVGAALRAGGNLHTDWAVNGVDFNLGAQGSVDHVDTLLA